MNESTTLSDLLRELTDRARVAQLSDSAWAARAGLPKETLSRLRRRKSCELQTLIALAGALGVQLCVRDLSLENVGANRRFPAAVDREYEQKLVDLVAASVFDADRWLQLGPGFFMGGLAVMMASIHGFDRRRFLELGEDLHPGVSEPEVFQRWLKESPVKPSRFLPLVTARNSNAA